MIDHSPVTFSGVAVGAGWQGLVAYINIGAYYLVGLPIALLMGFKFGFGLEVRYGDLIDLVRAYIKFDHPSLQ